MTDSWWHPEKFRQKIPYLQERARLMQAVANDPANTGRGLALFESAGLITLTEGVDIVSATPADIVRDAPRQGQHTAEVLAGLAPDAPETADCRGDTVHTPRSSR